MSGALQFTTPENGRVATVRENIWKMNSFPGQGKIREFCGLPGKFRKKTWKVSEKSKNLKINGYGRQSSENLFCSKEERMYILTR